MTKGVSCPVGRSRGKSPVTPRLLDLFCGAGGAAMGYHRAGFDVVGVDIRPQPNYPFRFYLGDALDWLRSSQQQWNPTRVDLTGFDAIHASPPCQRFTNMSNRWRGTADAPEHPDLLTPTLALLRGLELPWVVENVPGSAPPLRPTLSLHGGMFGLRVNRPRLFESNVLLLSAPAPRAVDAIGVYGKGPDGRQLWRRSEYHKLDGRLLFRAPRSLAEAQAAMGMDWGDWHGVKEAIPPAYTELIGHQLMQHLRVAA
jgi:DNA (cytosine-5)-methyltransferase 1